MRVCWNWQTGTFEGRVFHDVRVQVPSLAPVIKAVPKRYSLFFVYGGQGKSAVGISHKMRVSVDSVCGGLWLFSIQI